MKYPFEKPIPVVVKTSLTLFNETNRYANDANDLKNVWINVRMTVWQETSDHQINIHSSLKEDMS